MCVRACMQTHFLFFFAWLVPRDPRTIALEQSLPLVFISFVGVCLSVCVFIVFHGHVCDMLLFMA